MRIACGFAAHRAHAEPLGRVVAGILNPAVIQHQNLGPPAFQKQLSVIRTRNGVAQKPQRAVLVQCGFEWAKSFC